MPKGELYIRTRKTDALQEVAYEPSELFTSACSYYAGIVTDVKSPFYGYVDAWERYGLSLSDGSVDKLMCYSPMKQVKGVSLVVKHGVSYDGSQLSKYDERVLSLEAHIVARSMFEYLRRRRLFFDEVLSNKVLVFRTRYEPFVFYRLIYSGCEPFRQWMSGGAAMFTLSFTEPHPEYEERGDYTVIAVVDDAADLEDVWHVHEGEKAMVLPAVVEEDEGSAGEPPMALGEEESEEEEEVVLHLWTFHDDGGWAEDEDDAVADGSVVMNRRNGDLWRFEGGNVVKVE